VDSYMLGRPRMHLYPLKCCKRFQFLLTDIGGIYHIPYTLHLIYPFLATHVFDLGHTCMSLLWCDNCPLQP